MSRKREDIIPETPPRGNDRPIPPTPGADDDDLQQENRITTPQPNKPSKMPRVERKKKDRFIGRTYDFANILNYSPHPENRKILSRRRIDKKQTKLIGKNKTLTTEHAEEKKRKRERQRERLAKRHNIRTLPRYTLGLRF